MKNDYEFVDGTRLSAVIEALIFASEEPIPGSKIREIIVENEEQIEVSEESISDFVDKLNDRYAENGLSFRIQLLGGGYTFVTEKKYHYWLSIFQHQNAYRKLSQSAIESLAIVAYRQPITKPEVDQIRGVDSGYILRQLMEKALIEVSGRADSPGKPLLYKTTKHFLQHFGINSVDELPKPREIDEILKDDDMAEHRQLLMERQLMMDDMEQEEGEGEEESAEEKAEKLFAEFEVKKAAREEDGEENEEDRDEDGEENEEDRDESEAETAENLASEDQEQPDRESEIENEEEATDEEE